MEYKEVPEFNLETLKSNVETHIKNSALEKENEIKKEIDEVLRDLDNLVKKYVDRVTSDLINNCSIYKKAMLDASKNGKTSFCREYIIPYEDAFMGVLLYKKSYLFPKIFRGSRRSIDVVTKAISIYSKTHLESQYEKICYMDNNPESKYYAFKTVLYHNNVEDATPNTGRFMIYEFPIFVGEVNNRPCALEKIYYTCQNVNGCIGWKYYYDLLRFQSKINSDVKKVENYQELISSIGFIKYELNKPEFMGVIGTAYDNIELKVKAIVNVPDVLTRYRISVEFNW